MEIDVPTTFSSQIPLKRTAVSPLETTAGLSPSPAFFWGKEPPSRIQDRRGRGTPRVKIDIIYVSSNISNKCRRSWN